MKLGTEAAEHLESDAAIKNADLNCDLTDMQLASLNYQDALPGVPDLNFQGHFRYIQRELQTVVSGAVTNDERPCPTCASSAPGSRNGGHSVTQRLQTAGPDYLVVSYYGSNPHDSYRETPSCATVRVPEGRLEYELMMTIDHHHRKRHYTAHLLKEQRNRSDWMVFDDATVT